LADAIGAMFLLLSGAAIALGSYDCSSAKSLIAPRGPQRCLPHWL